MMKDTRTFAIVLEGVGCCTILSGLVIEIALRADLGYVLITSGALVVALGGCIFAKVVRR